VLNSTLRAPPVHPDSELPTPPLSGPGNGRVDPLDKLASRLLRVLMKVSTTPGGELDNLPQLHSAEPRCQSPLGSHHRAPVTG
jgi:hypothetical protein